VWIGCCGTSHVRRGTLGWDTGQVNKKRWEREEIPKARGVLLHKIKRGSRGSRGNWIYKVGYKSSKTRPALPVADSRKACKPETRKLRRQECGKKMCAPGREGGRESEKCRASWQLYRKGTGREIKLQEKLHARKSTRCWGGGRPAGKDGRGGLLSQFKGLPRRHNGSSGGPSTRLHHKLTRRGITRSNNLYDEVERGGACLEKKSHVILTQKTR